MTTDAGRAADAASSTSTVDTSAVRFRRTLRTSPLLRSFQVAMDPQLQCLETIVTCRGNFYAPDLHNHVSDLKKKLQHLIADGTNNFFLKKVEPWNSVRVTFNMPVEAARRLRELAEQKDSILHELGILAVEIGGDGVMSLTLEGKSTGHSSTDVISFPSHSDSNRLQMTTGNQQLEGNEVLEKIETSATLTAISAALGSFVNSSTNSSLSVYKEKADMHPAHVQNILLPISRKSDCISASAALTQDPMNVNSMVHARLGTYELQSLQRRCERPSDSIHDISAETSNGLDKPACIQTRLNLDEGQTVPISLGMLRSAAAQSYLNRGWSRLEDRLPISNNNIASSSPLLVNLLKSPGSRHPQLDLLVPCVQNPDVFYSGVAVPQKRRRSQRRASKRQKFDFEGKKSREMENGPVLLLSAVGCSLVSGERTLSQTATDQSVPSAAVSSSIHNITIGDPLLASTVIACLDSQNKQHLMINPYTGNLEEVGEIDDFSHGHDSVSAKPLKETRSCWQNGCGPSAISYVTNGSVSSSPVSSSGFQEPIHRNASVTVPQTPLLQSVYSHNDHKRNSEANEPPVVGMSTRVEVKDAVSSVTRTTLESPNSSSSLSTSVVFDKLNSVTPLATFSKPQTASGTAEAFHLYHPSSSETSHAGAATLPAESSILQHVSLSHSGHKGTMSVIQSKPISSSIFTAVCTTQTVADSLPVPGVPSSLSQLNHLIVTSSFHQFCSGTIHDNTSSIIGERSPLGATPSSSPCPDSLTSDTDLNRTIVSEAVALPRAFAEHSFEQSAATVASVATDMCQQRQQVFCSAIFSKLPVGNKGCLLEIDKTERIPMGDIARSSVTDVEEHRAVCLRPSASESAATSASVCVANISNAVTEAHSESPSNFNVQCSFKPEISEDTNSHVQKQNSFTNDFKNSLTFPCNSLSQDLLSLSVALSQSGQLPVMSCLSNLPGESKCFSVAATDGQVFRENSSSNFQTDATTATAAAHPTEPFICHKDSKDDGYVDDAHVSLSSSDEDLTLSSETSINSFPLPGISISKNVADQEIPVSSLPEVTALDIVDSRADAVFQAPLQDVLNIHDCNLQTGPEKSVDFVYPCNVSGKSVLSNEPVVIIAATSTIDSSSFPKKHILPPAILKSPNSLQVTKPEAANPLQSFFQFPISGSQLTRDAKLMLPVSGLKALSVSEMANSDSLHSLHETESALTQTAFEKFSCLSSEKLAMAAVGPMSSNSLCREENLSDQFTGTAKIKQDEDLERAEEQGECGDSITLSCEGLSRNVMTPVNLQDVIVMQVTSSDVVTSNSEVATSKSGEESVHSSELKVPQQVSALSSAGQAMKLPLFSDAKTFATRESIHRKSGRPIDESSPRNKATLTVAKLLEKADSSKMNSQPTNRLTDSTTSLENSLRQSAIMSQLPFSKSSISMTSFPMETTNRMATISPSAARMNFATISVNCLPAKLPMHLSTNLTRSFLIVDPTPLSITAPSYPLNLTESVQRVMSVVGLDSSPPPSPKLLASNRMSPAKFGGVLTSAAQLRSIALYGGTLAGKMVSENKSKELKQKTPAAAAAATSFSVTEIMSIPDCPKSTVDLSFSDDLAQQKSTVSDPRMSSGESTSQDSTFCQSEPIAVHLPIAPILAKVEDLSEEKKTLSVSADKGPNVAVFCAADHSYSAMPIPFADKSSDDFCNDIEDLPEYLNSVEDCHDVEEQFCEITETLVNHFEDQDLFVDDLLSLDSFMVFDQLNETDLGNCNDSLEEDIEECVNDCVKKPKCSYLMETDCSEETLNENCLQHQEENLKLGSKDKAVGGHGKDQLQSMEAEMCLSSDNVTSSENCATTVDRIQVDGKVLTRNNAEQMPPKGRQVEKMHSQPLLGSAILNVFPLEEVSSDISENIARENASHIACNQTTGNGVSLAASNCDDRKSQMQRTFPLQSSKSRKGARNCERRGGRFVRIRSLDVQLDSFDESEKTNSSENSVDCISGSLASVDSKGPFLMTDSLKCLPSCGHMTMRSRGRKSTRPGENAAMLAGDELLSTDWTTIITECHLSPVASKLSEIDHCLENPILLRRSTRNLRKGGSVSSGEPNNCGPDSKFVARRSCKRVTKYLQLTGTHSAQNAMTEITGDYQETSLSSQIPCIMDANKGTMVNHDEPTLSKDGKELPMRKSKT